MNEKGKEVSPNLDSQICVYSDTSNEGYGRYVFYLDFACGNVFVKDRGLYIDSMSSYCDASKVNYELYGNMSGRDMICSKKKKKKKGKRKVQGVPQSQTAALPRPKEEEGTDESKQAHIEQTYEKH